jgi:hypothetical protein
LSGNSISFNNVVHVEHSGNEYRVISSNREKTLNQLKELGAQNIIENRMTIDDISVQIIKKNKSV